LEGEFAIKVAYFLCQQKAKNNRNFEEGGRVKANIFGGSFLPAQNCVCCCYGLRDAAYGYIVGLEVGKNCSEKKSKNCFLHQ